MPRGQVLYRGFHMVNGNQVIIKQRFFSIYANFLGGVKIEKIFPIVCSEKGGVRPALWYSAPPSKAGALRLSVCVRDGVTY